MMEKLDIPENLQIDGQEHSNKKNEIMKKVLIDMQETEVDSYFERIANYYGITYVVLESDETDEFEPTEDPFRGTFF